MKLITKIQSISDIITNSSSEVFIMYEQDAKYWEKEIPFECCSIDLIDKQWLIDNRYIWEFIFQFLSIDQREVSKWNDKWHYWEDPDEDLWLTWIEANIEMLEKDLFGFYYVDIEDHFENAYETIDCARNDALYSMSNH